MKYRTDFVTNSSSSSFVVEKTLEFEITDKQDKAIKANDLSFYIKKENGGEWGYNNNEEHAPKLFHEFAKRVYLYEDKKITISNIFNSKAWRKKFVDYLNEKYKTDVSLDELHLFVEEYEIGYGESKGNDIDLENKYLISCLHPVLKNDYKKSSFCIYDKKTEFWYGDYSIHKIKETIGKTNYYHYKFCDRYGIDCSDKFYNYIYEAYGMPKLLIDDISSSLVAFGLKKSEVEYLKTKGIEILYACNKSKENDVVVYKFSNKNKLFVVPFDFFVEHLNDLLGE